MWTRPLPAFAFLNPDAPLSKTIMLDYYEATQRAVFFTASVLLRFVFSI